MNKTLLLIICDFLLLNLIHFTAWDSVDKDDSVAGAGGTKALGSGMGDPSQDLDLVKLLLDQSEQENAATVLKLIKTEEDLIKAEEDLDKTEEDLDKTGKELGNAEKMNLATLSEYEQFKEAAQKEAEENTEQNQRLVNKIAELNTNIDGLKFNLNTTTTNLNSAKNTVKDLDKELAAARALANREKQAATNAKKEAVTARNEANAAQEVAAKSNAQVARANAVVVAAKERIKSADERAQAAQTKVVEVERNLAAAQTTAKELSKAVANERQDKEIAQTAAQQLRNDIAKKIPDQPINANMMATLYSQNHVNFNTQGKRTLSNPNYSTKTILIEAPTYDYDLKKHVSYVHAITHVDQSPLRIMKGALGWKETSGQLSKAGRKTHHLNHVRFLQSDPRIIIAPVGPPGSAPVKALGVKPYKLATKTFKFPKAFIMKKDGRMFGEVIFQRDLKNRDYVKMDKSFIRSAFMGEFNPTRGDLVFSQTGELLGIMANSRYCHIIKSVDPAAAIVFGNNDYAKVAKTLRSMHQLIATKPSELR